MTIGYLWIDIPSHSLTPEDKEILAHPAISGVILFSKNYESVLQLKDLTRSIRSISPGIIITADQEGGRVQRFVEGFTPLPAMRYWGRMYQQSPLHATNDMKHMLTQMMAELRDVGIHSSISPVLDLDYGRNSVIGERSFGARAELVTALGEVFVDHLHRLGAPVIGKHFPGHGFVTGDSHQVLPVDDRSFEKILQSDLQPFAKLAPRLDAIMPAHVVYSAVDSKPAGFSRYWLQTVLREQLKFNGLIITDDLTMQGAASYGDYEDRAHLALEAGADILSVCNSREGVIRILDRLSFKKDPHFSKRLQHYCRFDH